MKVTFVYPRFDKFLDSHPELKNELSNFFLGQFTTPPSLGIPILASLTPPETEIELVDDNVGDAPMPEAPRDLVAINCFTPQAQRAFELADLYRAHGHKVVMGGIFPSFRTEECLQHADSVNIGEGEPTWPRILLDVAAGSLQRVYHGGCKLDLSLMRPPRRDLFYARTAYDWDEDLVQIARGCSYNCPMCALPSHMGQRIRLRPVEQVASEIRNLRHENVYLADDILFFENRRIKDYAIALLNALAGLGKKFFVSSTPALNTEHGFLDLLGRAGVANFYCTMNVDLVSKAAIYEKGKERRRLADLVKNLNDRGIRFFGSFAIGRDWDDTSIAERILELTSTAGINTSEFFIFTPYPGGAHWDRMESQQRIIDRNWRHYNGANVVFKPERMSIDQLIEQFQQLWRGFYKDRSATHVASLEPATWKNGIQVLGKPLERQGVRCQAAITGIGILSPIGNSAAKALEALANARHGLGNITSFKTSCFRTNWGGETRLPDPPPEISAAEAAEYGDRYLLMAIAAARLALRDAGLLKTNSRAAAPMALVLGTCNGGLLSAEEEYKWLHGKSNRAFDEPSNLRSQYYGFGKAMAHALGLNGACWVITTACSSTTVAMALAADLIIAGEVERVLVGGADALCVSNMAGFDALKATSTGRIAPFSIPPGLNIGEGAAFWVLETMETALLRNARCHGKLAGSAVTSDAYHPTSPEPRGEGVARTLQAALKASGLVLDDIGCINAHATGTEANDLAETKGIRTFLGPERKTPVVALKSFFGHAMGATGILEATCGLLAMNAGFLPPTLNYSLPRPGCELDCVPNTRRQAQYSAFLSANYAFGGNNACVAVTSPDITLPAQKRPDRRVFITGIGTVCSLGLGSHALLNSLRKGRSGIAQATRLNCLDTKARLAGLVPEFSNADVNRRLDFAGKNLITRYSLCAAHMAMETAALKISQRNAPDIGVAMGVCNGTPESDHMNSVFSTDGCRADIANFSNIVPNSVAGWIAESFCCKGPNATFAPGHHAGIQSLAYAAREIRSGRAQAMFAGAADEVYPQMYWNYDRIGFLYNGADESNYRLRSDESRRKIIGEGAAMFLIEPLETAQARNSRRLAEILACAMTMDADAFQMQCLSHNALIACVQQAMDNAKISFNELDIIVWAPQGNAQDNKTLSALKRLLGDRLATMPMLATTFHTGYVESASLLIAIAAAITALDTGGGLWPQIGGVQNTARDMSEKSFRLILALGSSDIGANFAAVLRTGTMP